MTAIVVPSTSVASGGMAAMGKDFWGGFVGFRYGFGVIFRGEKRVVEKDMVVFLAGIFVRLNCRRRAESERKLK